MNVSNLITPSLSLALFLIVEIIISWGLSTSYAKEKQQYQLELIHKLQTVVNAVVNIYGLVSQTVFEEVINKPELIELFKHAYTANTEQQAIIRQKMYEKLKDTYQRLEQKNLQQLHFHLPNNTSFLRMHKPDYFGDNLSNLRYTVKLTNELKQSIQGFEEGRIISAFRYVFPLFDNTTHLGSVETTMSFYGINKEITKLYPQEYQLIIKREVIFDAVFSEEQSNYIPCTISDDYMCEGDKMRRYLPISNKVKDIDHHLKNKFNHLLKENKSFVLDFKFNNTYYVLTFYPIKNLKNQVVAYIVGYQENYYFNTLQNDFYLKLMTFSLLNMLTFLFLYAIQRHNQVIENKNQMLIKADQEKNEFLGVVVHDLKNPLCGIQIFSEEIKTNFDHLSKDEIIEFAELINNSSKRMFELISNLLDINMIESGKFHLEFQQIDLLPVIKNVIQTYNASAQAKQLTIELNVTSNNLMIYADKNAVFRILDNLVSNAIKYSPWEKVVSIHVEEKPTTISCAIHNEGAGLTELDRQKLFQKFSRLTSKPTNGEHSTGLGLFIVKKLVDSIYADIRCESELNRGVTFIVEFRRVNK